ncbi:MAG: immunoglobulin domain-containing protein, partial [Limisphaerales bacterium]
MIRKKTIKDAPALWAKSIVRKTTSLLAMVAMGTTAQAAPLYWDNDQDATNNVLPAGTGLGGAGTWNTTDLKWWDGVSGANQAWVNANGDSAIFIGTSGAISVPAGVTVSGLIMTNDGNWSFSGSAITFTGANGTIDASGSSSNHIVNVIGNNTAGFKLTKIGSGNVSLHSGNTFTNLVVNEGTVTASANGLGVAAQLGAAPAGYTTNAILIQNGATVRTFKTGSAGSITAGNQGITIGAGGGTFVSIDTASSANLGILTPTAGAIHLGGNTLTFLGNHPVGVIAMKGPGTVIVGDETPYSGHMRFRTTAPTSDVKYNVAAGGVLDVDVSATTTELTGSGTILANTTAKVLTINQSTSTTFSGIFANTNTAAGATAIGVTKSGAGTLTLSGNSTTTGTFTISGGGVVAGHNNAFGPSGNLVLSAGHIQASASRTIPKNISSMGNNFRFIGSQALTFSGTVNLGTANTIFTNDNTSTTTFSGVMSGNASFSKFGNGRLVLSGNNTFTGTSGVLTNGAGPLIVNGTAGAATVVVTNYAAAILSGNGTIPGTVNNSGNLSPGSATNTIGTLTIGAVVNSAGSRYILHVNSGTVVEGTNQDFLNVTNTLTFAPGAHTIHVVGLSSPALNDGVDRSFRIATAAGGIVATDATFTVTTAAITLGNGSFRVRVDGNDLYLDFVHPSFVNASVINQSVNLGGTATFSVTASGSGTLSYQWFKGGVAIPGATEEEYSISNVQLEDAGTYSVEVSNAYGTASANGILAIRPYITTQPLASTNSPGDSYTFTVQAEGSGTLGYQWYKDGLIIPGATLNNLTFNPVKGTNAAEELGYHVVVSNNSDATVSSTPALFRVTPEIVTTLPATVAASQGNVVLPISATGTTNLSYFWYKGSVSEGNVLAEGAKYTGADSDTLTINNVVEADSGTYLVVVSNLVGFATNSTELTVSVYPAINAQPQSLTRVAGQTAIFTVNAVGLNIQYQWRKSGLDIPGATTSSLTLENVQAADEAAYDVVVSNEVDNQPYSVTSSAATLTVFYPLTATGPGAVVVNSNNTAQLEVVVTSSNNGPITYQWRKDGSALSNNAKYSGVNTATLTVLNAVHADAGAYELVLSAYAGAITNAGTLAVIDPPVVTVSPASRSVGVGTNTTFNATVVGTSPTYQWRKDGLDIPGATSASYTITGVALADEGAYTLYVSNGAGNDLSAAANLAVYERAVITVQPESISVNAGQTAELNVSATGRDLAYIWRRGNVAYTNDARISGQGTSSLSIDEVVLADGSTNITVVITNIAGAVTSSVVSITVNQAPILVAEPADISVRNGDSAVFSFAVTGNPLNYQWYKNGLAIPGATHSAYTNSNTQPTSYGYYHAVVTNPLGTITSREAVLSAKYKHVWQQAAGSKSYLGTSSTERGIAYNPFTQHIYVVSRAQPTPSIIILDRDGEYVGELDMTGITGGTFAVNRIAVSGNGQIYACNLNTANSFKVYRWIAEHSAPTEVYSGTPGTGTRWGDVFDVRGSGNGTQILIAGGANDTNAALLRTTTLGTSFTATQITLTPGATAGEYYNGFFFGAGNTFYTMFYTTGALKHWEFDPTTGAATLLSTMSGFDNRLSAVSKSGDIIYGLNYLTHRLQAYNISGGTPVKYIDYSFPTPVAANSFGTGGVVPAGDRIIGLESNNGMMGLAEQAFPTVTVDPEPAIANAGTTATFTAEADQPLVYTQWQKNGVSIAGATATTLSLNNVLKADEGNYSGILVSAVGPVKSDGASLTVIDPFISVQPANVAVGAGSNAVFSVTAAGTGLTYQWRKGGVDLVNDAKFSGVNTATLTIAGATEADEAVYSVYISGTHGNVTSSGASLSVEYAPTIVTGPSSLTRNEGGS